MGKWSKRKGEVEISESVIKQKSTEDLLEAQEWINKLLDYRKLNKLYSTYVKGIRRAIDYNEEDKVYVDFRLGGTITGRLSCAGYKAGKDPMGVSFHTLPRDKQISIRRAFVTKNDYVFITADYSTMELRVLCFLGQVKEMYTAFLNNKDLHLHSASLVFGKEEVTQEERQIAKMVSFLLVYGGSAFRLSQNLGIPLHRAEAIMTSYSMSFPEVFTYMEDVQEYIIEHQEVESYFGRIRHLPDIRSVVDSVRATACRQGVNHTVQSTASDILTGAMIGMNQRFRAYNSSARCMSTVHDSVEVKCKLSDLKRTLETMYHHMVNCTYIKKYLGIEFDVGFAIDVEVGYSFSGGISVVYNEGVVQNMDELMEYLK